MSSDHLTILERLRDEEAGWDNPEFVAALDAGIAALTRESAAHGTPTTCGDTCDCGYENKLNGQCSCGYVHEQPSTPDPRDQGETVMTQQELQAAVRRALAIFDQRVDVTGDMWSDSSYYTEMSECIEDAVHCGAQAATGDYQRLPDEAVIVPQVRVRIVAGELTQDGYTPVEEEKDRGAELEHALADLREVNQSMRGLPCPACAEKDQQIPAQQAETVEQEVTAYLVQGGFFNPEMAQHNNVCDLLMRCRDVVAALRAAVSPQALADAGHRELEQGERLLEWQRRAEAAEAALNAHLCEHDAADWLACSHQHVSTCAVCRLAEAEAEIARLREVFRMCRKILGY